MTWRRAVVALLVLWALALAVALQPHHHRPPQILHAPRLEPSAPPLPTLKIGP